MTIHHHIAGGVLFRGICSITGRPASAVSRCSMAHARATLAKNYPTLSDAAWISETRYKQASALRAKRYKLRLAYQEIRDSIDAGFIPSVRQLRAAGLL